MQFLLRLAANPLVPSPSLRTLVEYLDKSSCSKDLGRLLGESIAHRILRAQTKTIATLKRWPSVCAKLLTRYDVIIVTDGLC